MRLADARIPRPAVVVTARSASDPEGDLAPSAMAERAARSSLPSAQ